MTPVLRHRVGVLASGLICAILAIALIVRFGLTIDNSPETFERQGNDAAQVLRELQDTFGRDDAFVVLVRGDVVSPGFLDRMTALDKALKQTPLPTRTPTVTSLVSVNFPVQFGTSAVLFPLVDRELDQAFMRGELLENDRVAGRLVGHRGEWAAIWVRTAPLTLEESDRAYTALVGVVDAHRTDAFDPIVGGVPALEVRLNALTVQDMGRAFMVAAITMTVMLLLLFRHPLGMLGPLLVVQGSVLATFAYMAVSGTPINYLNSIVPTFLVAVGVGDGVHLQTTYRQFRADGLANTTAIDAALWCTLRPLCFTSFTTIAGLLAFRTATIQPIVELGTLGAFGVAVALLLTLTVLPAFLSYNEGFWSAGQARQTGFIDQGIAATTRLALRRPSPILAFGVLLAMGSLFLSARVQVSHDPLAWFPEHLPTKRVQRILDASFDGAAQFDLLVELDSTRFDRPQAMSALYALEAHVSAFSHPALGTVVGAPYSPTNFARETPIASTLFSDPDELEFAVDLLQQEFPDSAEFLLSQDRTKAHVVFPLQWLPATEYALLTAHLEPGIATAQAAGLTVRPTGLIYSLLSTMGQLVPDLIMSFATAFAIISGLMIVLLRDVKLGLIAMIPNLLPIAMAGGLMGALNLPLDASTLLIFSISLGLCVDDTIHLLHHFQAARAKGLSTHHAIEQTQRLTGRAIVYTSLILVAATAPTALSTLYSMVWFGGVLAWTVGAALVSDLLITPAVLVLVYPDRITR